MLRCVRLVTSEKLVKVYGELMVSTPASAESSRPELRLYTYQDVALLCGCTPLTVSRWVKSKKLKVTRLAQNRARIREDELVRFIESRTE